MVDHGLLVIGASYAGVQIAASARDLDYSGPITILGAEGRLPYQRPPLSKGFLTGAVELHSLSLRDSSFFERREIDLSLGDPVVEISMVGGIGKAMTSSGCTHYCDKLALTVGASPRRLRVPGAELDGVHYLRDSVDAVGLSERLADARAVVVIGGGFLGLEVAASARSMGRNVVVLEAAERLLGRTNSEEVASFFHEVHLSRGTRVRTGAQVAAVHGRDGRVVEVELGDGTREPADVVLVAIGVEPRTSLAERLGLSCEGGIVVNEYGQTSRAGVVAAGDCVVQPGADGLGPIRLESVQNATDQAKNAAATLLGKPVKTPPVPWFWSQQYELKLQTVGVARTYDRVDIHGEPSELSFSAHYFRDDELIAADCVNRPQEFMSLRRQWAAAH